MGDEGNLRNSVLDRMQLSMTLTQAGAAHMLDVLDEAFQYLALLRREVREEDYN